MNLDTLLKRYFMLVVLALIGVVAYFQASGVTQFVGTRLAVGADQLAAPPPAGAPLPGQKPAVLDAGSMHSTSGAPILHRNPFDSVTGPLDRIDAGEEADDAGPGPVDFSKPYDAPVCTEGTRVLIITASDDPTWSMAALSDGNGSNKTQLRRVGDTVGSKTVWYIAWDRIWLQGGGELCQAKMFADEPPPPPKPNAPKPPPAPRHAGGPATVPPEIASKIQKVSDTEFNVDRAVVDQILENQSTLMRSARIVPEKENGKVVGIRLLRVREDTLLGTLGLKNGDRVEKINGFDITSPDKALEAYARLRTAGNLSVSITRNGKPMTIDFNIR